MLHSANVTWVNQTPPVVTSVADSLVAVAIHKLLAQSVKVTGQYHSAGMIIGLPQYWKHDGHAVEAYVQYLVLVIPVGSQQPPITLSVSL